jgi:hypothetical protein
MIKNDFGTIPNELTQATRRVLEGVPSKKQFQLIQNPLVVAAAKEYARKNYSIGDFEDILKKVAFLNGVIKTL